MDISLSPETIQKIPGKFVKNTLGISDTDRTYDHSFSLTAYGIPTLKELREQIRKAGGKKSKIAVSAIGKYLTALEGKHPRASGAKQMKDLLWSFVAMHCPNYRIYKNRDGREYAYFVEDCFYTPERRSGGDYTPAYAGMRMKYVAFGKSKSFTLRWENSQCRTTAAKMLASSGYFPETDKLREDMEKSRRRYKRAVNKIGLQCRTSGWGYQNRYDRRGSDNDAEPSSGNAFHLGAKGESLVVIDTLNDDECSKSNHMGFTEDHRVSQWQWMQATERLQNGKQVDESDFDPEDVWGDDGEDDDEDAGIQLLPVHPLIPVFDLARHDWFTVHASDLKPYKYDTKISEKLVLDDDTKELVSLLASSKGEAFRDIVSGKSGGTTVLLAGPPGVGKTLTAEVFAENTERPLYRVNCSQLGVDPDDIETELMQVFSRAERWNAITLLDEADVYIRRRGDDLQMNAIIGVFLRVLEYQNTVLFMTTNLPKSVDDAIASRCVARIDYSVPSEENLKKIWKVLTSTTGVEMSDNEIEKAAVDYSQMSGRDVKNTIKLLMARSDEEITVAAIRRAAKFHPNRGNWRKWDKSDTEKLGG